MSSQITLENAVEMAFRAILGEVDAIAAFEADHLADFGGDTHTMWDLFLDKDGCVSLTVVFRKPHGEWDCGQNTTHSLGRAAVPAPQEVQAHLCRLQFGEICPGLIWGFNNYVHNHWAYKPQRLWDGSIEIVRWSYQQFVIAGH